MPHFAKAMRGKKIENFFGSIPKRSTGADCKSAGFRLRMFESCSAHIIEKNTVVTFGWAGSGVGQ